MEWVPMFVFWLFVKLGGGVDFPKGVVSRSTSICSEHISQKANSSDRTPQNSYMDDYFVLV